METEKKVREGSLKVSDEVVETVAGIAACDVDGVAGLTKTAVTFNNLLTRTERNGSVKLKMYGDVVEVAVSIVVKAGCKVVSVAENVQKAVKDNIQNMTGVTVSKVNVLITGIAFEENRE